jgi:hypothetical protein
MIPVKKRVLIGNSVPNNFDIYSTILGKKVISKRTTPIISHKKEYSSLSFLLRTKSIIPVTIRTPRIIITIFSLVEILNLLNYYMCFFLNSTIKIESSILTI